MTDQRSARDEITETINTQHSQEGQLVLVTGASGLVGCHLIDLLLQQGKTVIAVSRKTRPGLLQHPNLQWKHADILDIIALDELFTGVDVVYHCAAIVSFNAARKHELYQTNIEGTTNVVDAALRANVKKMCFVSSVAALGKIKNGTLINEKAAWTEETNASNYGKSKHMAEVEVWRGIAEGLQAVIVNPSIILGAGDWNEGSTKMFKTAFEEFPYYTEGITGFVDVKDVVRAMVNLMDSDISGERFILNAENRKYKEVLRLAAQGFHKKPPHKKVNRLMAGLVWRASAIKGVITGDEPLLTKETAEAAQSVVLYDNTKLTKFLPSFTYTPLEVTIPPNLQRVAGKVSAG